MFHLRFLLFFSVSLSIFANSRQFVTCDVLIVGAGPGGLHSAYALSKSSKNDVCVIEKELHVGGRLYDIAFDPNHPDLVYGLGALRVVETQQYVLNLGKELGIEFELAPYRDDLINTRGIFSFSSNEIKNLAYPLVMGTEDGLYNELLNGPERKNARNYPDLRSYMQSIVGSEGYLFLRDISRFRADFEAPIDAASYLNYLDEEMKTTGKIFYPVGGMSSFAKRMASFAQNHGVRFYLKEPAQNISKQVGDDSYLVNTPRYAFSARRLIIATPAQALQYVGGEIIHRIRAQKQFQDILGIQVVTIGQRWPHAWWLQSGYEDRDVRRAWTTEHCLNFIEIPINSYAAQQNVTRSVYDDDHRCAEFWKNTYKRFGIKAVEDEILRGLKHLFPKADIPRPLNTVVQIWPAAWYFLKAGTQFSNQDIAEWATHPLSNEEVSLVGESYYTERSGWSDAAYKSSIKTLNSRFGLNIKIPDAF